MPQPPTSAPAASNGSSFHPVKEMKRQISQSLIGEEVTNGSFRRIVVCRLVICKRFYEFVQCFILFVMKSKNIFYKTETATI